MKFETKTKPGWNYFPFQGRNSRLIDISHSDKDNKFRF